MHYTCLQQTPCGVIQQWNFQQTIIDIRAVTYITRILPPFSFSQWTRMNHSTHLSARHPCLHQVTKRSRAVTSGGNCVFKFTWCCLRMFNKFRVFQKTPKLRSEWARQWSWFSFLCWFQKWISFFSDMVGKITSRGLFSAISCKIDAFGQKRRKYST